MSKTWEPETKVCTVCLKPYERQRGRCDRLTCSNKCRQQAHRNRLCAERRARYEEGRQARHQLQALRAKRNAARRKARKAAKPKRRSKT